MEGGGGGGGEETSVCSDLMRLQATALVDI